MKIRPRPLVLATRSLSIGLGAWLAGGAAASAADLIAFTSATALRQGTFEVGGVHWNCDGELCGARGPDDRALWPGLCAAFARAAGPVIAFGSVGQRFDGAAIGRCNATATVETAPSAPAPPEEVAPKPAPAPAAEPTGPMVPTSTPDDAEALCNGRDDDADGRVDEGLRVRTWEDRDRDLFGDPGLGLEVCPQQLRPGLVLNDYDCDDSDPKRNPSRDNCP